MTPTTSVWLCPGSIPASCQVESSKSKPTTSPCTYSTPRCMAFCLKANNRAQGSNLEQHLLLSVDTPNEGKFLTHQPSFSIPWLASSMSSQFIHGNFSF